MRLSALRGAQTAIPLRPEAERILALIEARLGDANAVPRIEAVIARQHELGVSGLRLGLSCEARCQIAIWQRDASAFEEYAQLTAHEYRYGAGSALGARYERMLNEARRQGLQTTATLEHFAGELRDSPLLTQEVRSAVRRSMVPEQTTSQRLLAALQLICSARQVSEGQLYVRGASGLELGAAMGEAPLLSQLDPLERFLDREAERAQELDEMSTDELISSEGSATVQAGELQLELLPLAANYQYIGVIAVPAPEKAVPEVRERQLLSSIAAQLLALRSA